MNSALKFLLANSLAFVLAAPLQLAVAEHHEEEKSKTSQDGTERSMESKDSMTDDKSEQQKMQEQQEQKQKQMEEHERPYDSGAYPGQDEAG
ncbi:hypothetical protein [Azotobacter beijerinckii]|uniref:hypothetical protein n=1 Tax=Azotobacter beijerinckii TaxID=170623 RepID=UPI00295434ED|nr:hypothetical protein [Azotobacter beijerinckii]MDV7211230.1 hypothetical protein [Azotobacter beijerinckii]